MTSIWNNVYIDKLDDIVNKYNKTYNRTIKMKHFDVKSSTHNSTIKMKHFDVKSSTYIDASKKINDEDSKFKAGDIVRISKYKKKNLQKAMFQIDLKNFLWLKKLKTLCFGHILLYQNFQGHE